jgi:hypothetical protein
MYMADICQPLIEFQLNELEEIPNRLIRVVDGLWVMGDGVGAGFDGAPREDPANTPLVSCTARSAKPACNTLRNRLYEHRALESPSAGCARQTDQRPLPMTRCL